MLMRKTQQGFTLIELMISISIGIFLISGAMTVFSSTVSTGSRSISTTRLNQDLQSILDVIGNEVKRAGYIKDNNNVTTNTIISVPNSTCLLYEYDTTPDGSIGSEDKRGFRYNSTSKTVEFRNAGATGCTGTSNWNAINDMNSVEITGVNISLISSCYNMTQYQADGTSCNNANNNDYMLTSYVVNVSVTGRAKNDADTARTVSGSYRMRSNKYTQK